jgi:hypothetical protein
VVVIAFGDDDVIIPVAFVDGRPISAELPREPVTACCVLSPNNFQPRRHDLAGHTFFIKNAGVGVAGFHVCLVTAHHPAFLSRTLLHIDAGIGNSSLLGVILGAAQFETLTVPFPD